MVGEGDDHGGGNRSVLMTPRLYSASEANAVLPEVIPLLEAVRRAAATMESLHEDVMSSVPTNGGGAVHTAFIAASREQDDALGRLTELGIIVRDPATGLCDFPSEREGEQIFLCFKLGEARIEFWHDTSSGYAGRQPL